MRIGRIDGGTVTPKDSAHPFRTIDNRYTAGYNNHAETTVFLQS